LNKYLDALHKVAKKVDGALPFGEVNKIEVYGLLQDIFSNHAGITAQMARKQVKSTYGIEVAPSLDEIAQAFGCMKK